MILIIFLFFKKVKNDLCLDDVVGKSAATVGRFNHAARHTHTQVYSSSGMDSARFSAPRETWRDGRLFRDSPGVVWCVQYLIVFVLLLFVVN